MERRTPLDATLLLIKEMLPAAQRQSEETGRETVQVVVWLVGLSSALLTILAGSATLANALSEGTRTTLVTLLASVVTLGVLQRIAYHRAEMDTRALFQHLHGYLIGYTAGPDIDEPDELSNSWSCEDVVEKLRANFDVDYRFLLESKAPIESCRRAYLNQYELWQKQERERKERVSLLLGAYQGKSEETSRAFFDADGSNPLDGIRVRARQTIRTYRVAFGLYYATGAAFVAAVIVLAVAVA